MTPLEAHNAKRPEMPRPLPPATDPVYKAWLKAFTEWVSRKEQLETDAALEGVQIEPAKRMKPSCTPRADYQWRQIA